MADAVVKGLRFLFERLEELQSDIVAARAQLTPQVTAVPALQAAFVERFGLAAYPSPAAAASAANAVSSAAAGSDAVAALQDKLPRTFAWAERTVAQSIPAARAELQPYVATSSSSSSSAAATLPSANVLRTGRRVSSAPGGGSIRAGSSSGAEGHLAAVEWGSPAVAVRVGLVDMVAAAEGAQEGAVAEAAWLEVERIREAQNEFQCVVVVATGLLILRQLFAARAVLPSPAVERAVDGARAALSRLVLSADVSRAKLAAVLADAIQSASSSASSAAPREPLAGVPRRAGCT
eukprot:TRINITY_DN7243_c0_g1_i2.p1 TRINITY_DN7243_c0_g1~~TRINITY_DN7243_c0_g1_i2.p1  ORF type:complete len:304 (-),score=1.23 TRINITY_DN7243_c0_g1_i2:558-1436(-)